VRLLAVSDLHYRLPHYDWLVGAAVDVDAVAIIGDLADVVSPVPMEAQVVVLQKYLARLADEARVLVTSGNHDLDGPGEHGEQVAGWLQRVDVPGVTVDGQSIDLDGTRYTLCPWWDGPISRDAIDRQLAEGRPDDGRAWTWLYHSPPAGTVLCRDGRREFPDHELAGWIDRLQPGIVLCGHIHQAPWLDDGSWHAQLGRTWVFNAGKQRSGPVPAHITIDTVARTAEWFGVYSTEHIDLGPQ